MARRRPGSASAAIATGGVGLSGEATTGYALRTKGRVRLDQSAGQATITSGTSSVVVTPGIDLTATTAVVATLNGDAGGSTAVKRVAINATANTFTIYLTGNAAARSRPPGSCSADRGGAIARLSEASSQSPFG